MTQLTITREAARAWLAAHGADADFVFAASINIDERLGVTLELCEYEHSPTGELLVQPGLTSPRYITSTRPLLSLPQLATSGYRSRPDSPVAFLDAAAAVDIMRHASDAPPRNELDSPPP